MHNTAYGHRMFVCVTVFYFFFRVKDNVLITAGGARLVFDSHEEAVHALNNGFSFFFLVCFFTRMSMV